MLNAIRHALRSLRRTPVFAAAAVLTLALGVASLVSMFAIVFGVLLAPLRYGHPDRLVSVGLDTRADGVRHVAQPDAMFFTYRRFARGIAEVGFYRTGNANIWRATGNDEPERITSTWITASMIPLLQVKPILGRSFTREEDAPGAQAVILSESVWRSRFHSDPDVLGQKLMVNAVPRIVVGVMPASFVFPTADTRIWLPTRLDPNSGVAGDFSYSGVARLAPGVTPQTAQRDLALALRRLPEIAPRLESGTSTTSWLDQTQPTPTVVPLRDELTQGVAPTLWILGAAAALVLLVALANVSNLMLIRADGRQLELAVRQALGASRLRVIGHFLGESLVISVGAGALALAGAWQAVRALVAFGPADVPRLSELGVGWSSAAFTIAIVVVGALACAGVPALRVGAVNLSINLREGGRSDTIGKTRQRLRGAIAGLQIALAFVVAAGSVLLLRTARRLHEQRAGFDATNVIATWTQLPFARYGDSASVTYYARLTEAVGRLPGVQSAGVTTLLPLGAGETIREGFRIDGTGRTIYLPAIVADDGYFNTLRIPLVAGRGFQTLGVQRDGDVILSRRAAVTIWGDSTGQSAIGRRLSLVPSGPTYTVVGVVGDVRDRDLAISPTPTMYLPQVAPLNYATEPSARRTMALVVRTSAPPAAVGSAIRNIARELDPTVPVFNVQAMSDVVRASTARLSLTILVMTAAAVITLVLGAIGLYGVVAYTVALRTREFGVRIALGADPARLARAVVWRGLALVAFGLAGGLALYALASPLLRAVLYGVTTTDPVTLIGATLALAATAALASWVPARRAAQVDPADALRAD